VNDILAVNDVIIPDNDLVSPVNDNCGDTGDGFNAVARVALF